MKKYPEDELRSRLLKMYPDIENTGVSMNLNYDDAKKSYAVKLTKNGKDQMILLPEADAETCMSGSICQPFRIELTDVLNRFAGK